MFKKKKKLTGENEKNLLLEAFNFKDLKIKDEFNASVKNFNIKITCRNLALIFLGSLLTTLSFYYFINPANLYTNGLSSFAQLISKAIFFSYSTSDPTYYKEMTALYFYPIFFAMNVPIIIWGIFKIGIRFSIYTTIYIGLNIAITTLLSLTPGVNNFSIFNVGRINQSDLGIIFIFATLGGLVYGVGLGLLFKAGGSSGGMDFISTYISMKRKYSISKIIRNVNSLVVITAILIGGTALHKESIPNIFLKTPYFFATLLYINIASFAMNRVYPKYMMMTVFVISNKAGEIRDLIYSKNYLRGGNIWDVKGLYSGSERKMLMTTMSLLEYNSFKYKFKEVDPKLFMITVPTRYMSGGNVQAVLASSKNVKVTKLKSKNDKKD